MVRCDVNNETGDSHMVTVVTEDMYHFINLMNDYNLSWETVYDIVQKAIEEEDFENYCKRTARDKNDSLEKWIEMTGGKK